MDKYAKFIILLLMLLALSGCVNVAMSGASAVYNQHNLRKKFKDNYTTLQAYKAFNEHSTTFKDTNISVATYNKQVLLIGQVPHVWQRLWAERLVRKLPDVDHVYNQIAIASPSSVLTRMSDVWLTTKIKAKLIAADEIDATQVKVITENGIVYLMGIVTPEEANEAVYLASETDGVESVVKIFFYAKITRVEA